MNFIKKISLLSIIFMLSAVAQAKDYVEGTDYTRLDKTIPTQTGDKIEILEFFWYGCPHCFSFEPTLKKWQKNLPENTQFVRMPSPLNPRWMVHTKTYYTLQLMGLGEKYHEAIFQAMHVEKQKLYSKIAMADFLASRGIDKEVFNANFDSFAVEMRARQAMQLGQDYGVSGVPMLAINGKYTISASQAGGYDAMVDVANYLIKKDSK